MKLNKLIILVLVPFVLAQGYDIYPEISANIIKIKQPGDRFKKGDTLVQFDARQIEAKISKARAELANAKIIFDDKKLLLDQDTELYDSTVIAKRNYDDSKLIFDLAETKYNQQKANLAYLLLEKEKYTIKSPMNGIVKGVPHPRNVTNINAPKILMIINKK